MNAAILSVSVFVIMWLLHNLQRLPSICSSNVLVAEYTKFYLMARLEVFQRLIHFSHVEKEAPASILAAILTTHVPFTGKRRRDVWEALIG